MISIIKFAIIAAIIFLVARTARKKNPAQTRADSSASGANGPSPEDASTQELDFHVDQWLSTADELSASFISPGNNPNGCLAIAGEINSLPFRIELRMKEKLVDYILTLPYEPQLKTRSFVVRNAPDRAFIAKNTVRLLCPGMSPQSAILKDLAAHAGRLLQTIPFEEEAPDEDPVAALPHRRAKVEPLRVEIPSVPIPEPVVIKPKPIEVQPEPVEVKPEPIKVKPEPVAKPEPAPAVSDGGAADGGGEESFTPESLAEVLFRSTLPGPKEKEYFASLTGRRVEWSGTVRMAYEISSDFVFGSGKAVKVQMDLCTINGKYGRQTLRGTAVFPPADLAVLRAASQKTIRFRGTILKLESFSREVYLSKGELL